jgi:hypothetical protein
MMFTVMMSHCISFIGDDNDWKEILWQTFCLE